MIQTKKLIEVALPLVAINLASAREKSIRHGHPSTLHLWWARRPLAAARAVIFAQMVDDPSAHPDLFKTAKAQEIERERLFRIIEELVKWENTTNEAVLQKARDEIWQSWRYSCAANADHPRAKELFDRHKLPAFHDPFAGGGALPVEAQRLGLESYASDLNPVAVLINKAMIEVPPKFKDCPPVNSGWQQKPDAEKAMTHWSGANGFGDDLRHYGRWVREQAEKRVGSIYPKAEVTADMALNRQDLKPYIGQSLTVIAWIWVRTVKSPDPAFADVDVPLASSFMLSNKLDRAAYVEVEIIGKTYTFNVKVGQKKVPAVAKSGTKLSGANFRCVMSGSPIPGEYIKAQGMAGKIGARLMAIAAEGKHGRVYLAPTIAVENAALAVVPTWRPEGLIATRMTGGNCTPYGLTSWADLFTARQLVVLTTFSDLIGNVREQVRRDAAHAGIVDDGIALDSGGAGASAYADSVAMYLAFAISRSADRGSNVCSWDSSPKMEALRNTFGRHAIPMVWDFAEGNPFSESSGNWMNNVEFGAKAAGFMPAKTRGYSKQAEATTQTISAGKVISTDPPYFDNIGYADLSDFFYVWLRRSLKSIFPSLFETLAVPKVEELVATAYRHGGKEKAEAFFLAGMTRAMHILADQAHPAFPVTIYYAFKQSQSDGADGTTNTGWDTFLEAVIEAGFAISGTWPIRTELSNRMIGSGTNALASSIVLVCTKRDENAPDATRREFVTALKEELPRALEHLQAGNIAPVDLAQAAIGPGMAVYTRYSSVLDATGERVSVRSALSLINQTLDEALAKQEGDFDAETRWALTWFEQSGFTEGDFGIADQLSKSKNTAVGSLVRAGILFSKAGKVRLLKPAEMSSEWDPSTDERLTVWEIVHQIVRALETEGEEAAALIVAKLGNKAETARELCYRLYALCERKKRSNDATAYNGLVQSWPEIARLASNVAMPRAPSTTDMFAKD